MDGGRIVNRTYRRIVVAGASGFVGRKLIEQANATGFRVVALSRTPKAVPGSVETVVWDGEKVGPWSECLEGAFGVINLCGSSISEPWTVVNRQKILSSRVKPTQAIAEALLQAKNPPLHWVNASAIGYYGDTGDHLVDEAGARGSGFLGEVCGQWEQAALESEVVKSGKVSLCRLRIGIVLGRDGGYFAQMKSLTQKFLGGHVGSGKQWLSWIHEDDLARLFVHVLEHDTAGAFNGVTPEPVRQMEFMAMMREKLGMPWSPPVPVALMGLAGALMKVEPSLALVSQRVQSSRMSEIGFDYRYPDLEMAVLALLR